MKKKIKTPYAILPDMAGLSDIAFIILFYFLAISDFKNELSESTIEIPISQKDYICILKDKDILAIFINKEGTVRLKLITKHNISPVIDFNRFMAIVSNNKSIFINTEKMIIADKNVESETIFMVINWLRAAGITKLSLLTLKN